MRKTITDGDGQPYLYYVWITLQLYPPPLPAQGLPVQLIVIKFTVATNTTHVKILSSLLKCVYMQTQFKVRVLVAVRAGDEIASN